MISDKDLSSILQKSEKFEAPPAEETPLATDSLGAEMGQPSVPGAVQPGPLSFTERLEQESSPFDEAVTLEEGAREAAIGAVEEGSKSVAALGTGLKFGQRGAQLMAPFFPPYGAVAGGTLGFVTGSVLGYTGADALLQDVFPIPARDELVPYREGGKSFGTAMSLYPVAFYLPAAGPTANRLSRYISEVGDTTRKSPVTTGLSTFSASSKIFCLFSKMFLFASSGFFKSINCNCPIIICSSHFVTNPLESFAALLAAATTLGSSIAKGIT
jgi:hypothetical protein